MEESNVLIAVGVSITSNSDSIEEQLQIGLDFMNEYDETFQELAK
jgi:hypothetical protein